MIKFESVDVSIIKCSVEEEKEKWMNEWMNETFI